MFLEQTIKQDRELIEKAFMLHQKGQIMPDSYVIDVDTFLDNSKAILQAANNNGMDCYFMLKQVGRNPFLARKLVDLGYKGAVVVDYIESTPALISEYYDEASYSYLQCWTFSSNS